VHLVRPATDWPIVLAAVDEDAHHEDDDGGR
jgi:hypothetical protein